MIDQATIDRIMDTAQIVDVVSDFVSLKRRGANYIGLCPFHNEKTPSFSVSPAKNICKCFSCGKGGNPVNFIMEHEQMSYIEALKFVAKKYHIEVEERELSDAEKQVQSTREGMLIVNAYAQQQFTKNLFETDEGQNIGLSYFHERGFRNDIIQKFQLGYSFEQRDHFSQLALKNGYNKEFLYKTGLSMEGQNGFIQDRFRGRVMFPVHSLSGKILAFGGRILKKNDKLAKYVNSPESEIYHKSNELYGIYFAKGAINKHDRCFLVEGYTDVLAMHQAGIENVVASSGTALTPGQIRMIHRFTPNITVLYDGDAAGIKASLRGIDLILKEGMNVKVVLLPDGDDPDSFSRKQSATSFMNYIQANETDFIRFKTSLLLEQAQSDPIKRAEMISDIVRSIAIIPDQIIRSVYIRETSNMLEIGEEVLIAEINKEKQKEKENELNKRPGTYGGASGYASSAATESASQPVINGDAPFPLLPEELGAASPNPAVTEVRRSSIFDRFEYAIIRYIVRYGEQLLYSVTDEESNREIHYRVIDYVCADLDQDEITFGHPLYARMLGYAREASQKENFVSETFFLNHPDPVISRTATDLVAEKYTLSKIHTKFATIEEEKDKLKDLIPRALFELKDAIIRNDIREINEQIKKLALEGGMNEVIRLMEDLKEKNEVRTALAKELGERIVTRF
ncbi:MAG: DNA primase [Bacteroidales bacterium]